MIGLSIFDWVLIIAAAVLQILLIVKFWRMCNDVRALRNHFVATNKNEERPNKENQPMSTGLYVSIIIAIVVLVVVLMVCNN